MFFFFNFIISWRSADSDWRIGEWIRASTTTDKRSADETGTRKESSWNVGNAVSGRAKSEVRLQHLFGGQDWHETVTPFKLLFQLKPFSWFLLQGLEEMTLDMHGHFPVATLIAILTLQHQFNRISSHTCSICSARPTRDWFVTCCYVTCALSDKEYWDQIALCSLRRQNCDLCFVQEFRLQVKRAISVWLRIASGQTEPGRMASHKQLS